MSYTELHRKWYAGCDWLAGDVAFCLSPDWLRELSVVLKQEQCRCSRVAGAPQGQISWPSLFFLLIFPERMGLPLIAQAESLVISWGDDFDDFSELVWGNLLLCDPLPYAHRHKMVSIDLEDALFIIISYIYIYTHTYCMYTCSNVICRTHESSQLYDPPQAVYIKHVNSSTCTERKLTQLCPLISTLLPSRRA